MKVYRYHGHIVSQPFLFVPINKCHICFASEDWNKNRRQHLANIFAFPEAKNANQTFAQHHHTFKLWNTTFHRPFG